MSDLLFSEQILPSFSKVENQNIYDTILAIIKDNKNKLSEIIKQDTFESLAVPMEELSVKLSNAWSVVNHLNSVISNDGLREAYEQSLKQIVEYSLFIEQNEELYSAYKLIAQNNGQELNNIHKKIISNKIRDFKLSGAELSVEKQLEFKQLIANLSDLTTKFNNNVLDCTDSWQYKINNKTRLDGLPEDIIKIAEKKAEDIGGSGWIFGLDYPTYNAVMKFAKDSDLRAAFHYAYATKSSKTGPHDHKYDNTHIMFEILTIRHKMARILGFENYAEYSLATKMVKDPKVVIDFLSGLVAKAQIFAQKEWEELKLFGKETDGRAELKPWDVAYYSELQKNRLFNLSDNLLKSYFPLDKVLSGFFTVVNKLYGIDFVINKTADIWHPDVICYSIYNADKNVIGYIYLDLYARPRKRGGAWMDECRVRCFTDNIQQLPVAYLTCNFTPKSDNDISLLNHQDVLTLFHEFGHCLHHLLTAIDYPSISGINGVPWDAVELPSQFHENWCWQASSLPLISGHYQTNEPLPDKYLKQLIKQKNYQSGLFLIRQLIFGLFDFRLHMEFHPDKGIGQIQTLLNEVRQQVSVLPYAEYDQFQNSFCHIFAGGYAAGYYSYLWAEVLAANCFEQFIQKGIYNGDIGGLFLDTILAKGGSIDINQAMLAFCGHEVKLAPLLQQYGLV